MGISTFLKKTGIMAVLLFSICFSAYALQSPHSNLTENRGCNHLNYLDKINSSNCFHAKNSSKEDFSFHINNFKNSIAQKSPDPSGGFILYYIYNIIYGNCENAKPIYFSNDMVKTNGMEKPANIRDANCEVGIFSFIVNITNHHLKTR